MLLILLPLMIGLHFLVMENQFQKPIIIEFAAPFFDSLGRWLASIIFQSTANPDLCVYKCEEIICSSESLKNQI